MSPRHNKRVRDAILRNSRPTKQLRLFPNDEETTTTVHYVNKEQFERHFHTCDRIIFADNSKVDTIIHRTKDKILATSKRKVEK